MKETIQVLATIGDAKSAFYGMTISGDRTQVFFITEVPDNIEGKWLWMEGNWEGTRENPEETFICQWVIESREVGPSAMSHLKSPKVLIEVSKGRVVGVQSTRAIDYIILDHDNIKEGDMKPDQWSSIPQMDIKKRFQIENYIRL